MQIEMGGVAVHGGEITLINCMQGGGITLLIKIYSNMNI